ncbi:MAG TPA: hypothetical protein VLT88_17045, partial [Desulfosarcina sp.]|nr:hypothetical protein [Desulfosarcina sp.]
MAPGNKGDFPIPTSNPLPVAKNGAMTFPELTTAQSVLSFRKFFGFPILSEILPKGYIKMKFHR